MTGVARVLRVAIVLLAGCVGIGCAGTGSAATSERVVESARSADEQAAQVGVGLAGNDEGVVAGRDALAQLAGRPHVLWFWGAH